MHKSHPLLASLNPEQRAVVLAGEGPLLVLAGAGSGKTRALTHRIAYLIASGQARAEEIVAVTFTNKAAREMRERLAQLASPTQARAATLTTFHSLCARLLREQWRVAGRSAGFSILDTSDSERFIRQALGRLALNPKDWPPRRLAAALSRAKNEQRDIVNEQTTTPLAEVVARVYPLYQQLLAEHDSYDFDDLILTAAQILAEHPAIRRAYQERWRHVLVDEYQDTNPPQDALLRLLVGPAQNVCVVGDDYQAIYSWRGARVDHILRFTEHFPSSTTIMLTQNYRSTPAILTAANKVIAANPNQAHKELWTARTDGTPITMMALPSDRAEAAWVISDIQKYCNEGHQPGDCAILYRTNAQSRLFEEACRRWQIPYTIVGGMSFYERAEIKDALALLQLWTTPQAKLAFRRVAASMVPNVGPAAVKRLMAAAAEQGKSFVDLLNEPALLSAAQIRSAAPLRAALRIKKTDATVAAHLRLLLTGSQYLTELALLPDGDERLANIDELYSVGEEYTDPTLFLQEVALLTDVDTKAPRESSLLCMTLHAAKGLEFPRVYVVGCEERLLPHAARDGTISNLPEERRLLYVGMTRAREHLTLTWALQRQHQGTLQQHVPSRFLAELADDELVSATLPDSTDLIAYEPFFPD